ncbi:MAG: hypothetical protein PHO15_10545, partial [Eubacteriales bacterium]|nr:hypothetical protein [Eubacteriales bacterium]
RISADGTKILLFTDVKNEIGDLSVCELGGEPESVASSVLTSFYGFSDNGENVGYIKMTEGDEENTYALYVSIDGKDPEKVEEGTGYTYYSVFDQLYLGNDGQVLYSYCDDPESGEFSLYLCDKDGDTDKIAANAYVVQTFDDVDDFLYYTYSQEDGSSLYYQAPGEEKERLSQEYGNAVFAPYFGADLDYVPDKHFMLVENDEDDSSEVTLYEVEIGEDPVKIAKCDVDAYAINSDFSCVAFGRQESLFLTYKTADGWSDRVEVGENLISGRFDIAGDNFYYIEGSSSNSEYGDFYRYSLAEEESELLQYDVQAFDLIEDIPYSLTTDEQVYCFDSAGEKEKIIDEDAYGIFRAEGGVYFTITANEYDILYFPNGSDEGETLSYDVEQFLYDNGGIVHIYTPPLDEDTVAQITQLYEDALLYIDYLTYSTYAVTEDQHMSWTESEDLADELMYAEGIPDEIYDMLSNFSYGFYYFDMYWYADYGSTEEQDYIDSCVEYLTDAKDAYEKYMADYM